MEEEDWWSLPGTFLTSLGASFAEARVVAKRNDDEIELRAKQDGFPFRIVMDVPGYDSEIEMRISGQPEHAVFDLEYDPDASPEHEPAASDPDWDDRDDDDRRIFLAGSVFVEGAEAGTEARSFLSLPPDLRRDILSAMVSEKVMYFRVRDDEIWVSFLVEPPEMADPASSLSRMTVLMAAAASAVRSTPPVGNGGGRAVSPVRCRYCGAWYFLEGEPKCANCGAPCDGKASPASVES